MKKLMFFAVALLVLMTAVTATACTMNDHDRPIKYDELPADARSFVDKYFAKEQVSYVTEDRDVIGTEYKLVFTSGTKLEFKGSGEWKEIDCRYASVPNDVIPAEIAKQVKERYPDNKIVELKRDYNEWEVKLTGGLELTFNKDYKLVDIDD